MLFKKNVKGFTLLEVIVYITIFAAILTVAILFTWDIIGSQTKSTVITEVNQNSRFILERVSRDFKQAVLINSITASTINFNTISGDTIIYDFDTDVNSVTRQLNSDVAIILNNSAVQISGEWFDLSTNQAITIGLDLSVQYTSDSGQTDWEKVLVTSSSYNLLLAS